MSRIHIKQHHKLSNDETRKRAEAIAKDLKQKYNIDYSWKADRLLFRRTGVTGFVALGEGVVEIEIKLGMLLAPMKSKIEASIRQDLQASVGNGAPTVERNAT